MPPSPQLLGSNPLALYNIPCARGEIKLD